MLENVYVLFTIGGSTFLWALWYVGKHDRFRKVHNLKLYFYPCFYLIIVVYLGLNVFKILDKNSWLWIPILYPFFFFESIAVAERSFRLKIQQKNLSQYIIKQQRKQTKYTKEKIEEYKVKFKREKIGIKSWSKKEIFKKGYKKFDKKKNQKS